MKAAAVILAIAVAAGSAAAQTRVRIDGPQGRSERELLELLGERLIHVERSPAAPHRADDAAFLLSRLLRRDGYAESEVDWRIISPNEILLTVRNGKRLHISEVVVSGVGRDDARRLARLYRSPAEKERSLLSRNPPFRAEDVAAGLAAIRQELHADGYWQATAELASQNIDPQTGAVDTTIIVDRGPRVRIGEPVVNSVDGRGVLLVTNVVKPFAGRMATTLHLNEMRLAAEQIAVSRGYPDAVIRMSQGPETAVFRPVFTVDLGTRVRLGTIRPAGLDLTDPDRLMRRFGGMEGEWYDEALVNRRLRELLATGAFESAWVETTSTGERRVDATLHFTEADAREVTIGAGFGSYQGLISRFGYADRNFGGRLWGLNAGCELSQRGLLGDVRITDPWFMGTDITASLRGYALLARRDGYNSYTSGVDASALMRFGDHYMVEFLVGGALVKTEGSGLPRRVLGDRLYTQPRLRVTQTLDHRDSRVLPKSGWHLQSPLEVGAAIGSNDTTYLATGLSGGWFKPLGNRTQLGVGGRFAMLIPGGDRNDLPIDIRLFNGGARSVRSFPERELGPQVRGYPVGGEAMWHSNMEVLREIAGPLHGLVFFDAGSLSRTYQDLGSADVELAAGLGIRFDLPVGPVRLEYGHNLSRDPGEPNGTFHFAIGSAF